MNSDEWRRINEVAINEVAINDLERWVQDALRNVGEIAFADIGHGLSDYDRGHAQGSITAYQHVLVELGHKNERKTECKTEMGIFDTWVSDVCKASPLTIGGAIEIYKLCERENIPLTDDLLRYVIQLGIKGKGRYEITQSIKSGVYDKAKKHSMWNISMCSGGNKC